MERSQSRAREQSLRPSTAGKAAEGASQEHRGASSTLEDMSAMEPETKPAHMQDVSDDMDGGEVETTAADTAGEETSTKMTHTSGEKSNDTDDADKEINVKEEDDRD